MGRGARRRWTTLVLLPASALAQTLTATNFVKYFDYDGMWAVAGTVTVTTDGTTQTLDFSLTGLDNLHHHSVGQFDRNRLAVITGYGYGHTILQKHGAVTNQFDRDANLFECIRMHEYQKLTFFIQEGAINVVKNYTLDSLGRSKAFV